MNAATSTRKTMSAMTADLVTSPPHDSDTFEVDTSLVSTWPALASAAVTLADFARSSVVGVLTWNVRVEPEPTVCALSTATPWPSTAERISLRVTPGLAARL